MKVNSLKFFINATSGTPILRVTHIQEYSISVDQGYIRYRDVNETWVLFEGITVCIKIKLPPNLLTVAQ